MKIKELEPEQKELKLIVKIEEKSEAREVISPIDKKFHIIAEAVCGDETGSIILTLWNENIEQIQEKKYYELEGAYTSTYRNSLRLNISRKGAIKETNAGFEINTANNRSLDEL